MSCDYLKMIISVICVYVSVITDIGSHSSCGVLLGVRVTGRLA